MVDIDQARFVVKRLFDFVNGGKLPWDPVLTEHGIDFHIVVEGIIFSDDDKIYDHFVSWDIFLKESVDLVAFRKAMDKEADRAMQAKKEKERHERKAREEAIEFQQYLKLKDKYDKS